MRVLIVKASSLGDIIKALPALDYLKQASTGIQVDWVVEESYREILEGNPLLDRLHIVRTKAWRQQPLSPATWREILQLRAALRERAYDIVFDLQGSINSGIVSWLTGSSRRYGFDESAVLEPSNTRFTNNQVPLRRQDSHMTDRALRVVSVPFGKDYIGLPLHVDIYTSPADDATAEVFLATLSDGLVFVFHPGAAWKTKLWHEAGWIDLGKQLLEQFSESMILISWEGKGEHAGAERIAAGIGHQTKLLPALSLKGFTSLMKKIDLMVGGDTGPIHIAAAAGTPTVSFYRATDGKQNGPRGEMHRLVQSPLSCTRCLKEKCDRDADCMQSISVEKVLQACGELLRGGVVS